jgi:hypothetical protein
VAIGAGIGRHSLYNASQIPTRRGFNLNDRWNEEEAKQLLRAALAEIDALGEKLSPARAEALLDEFEQAVGRDFLRRNLSAVKLTCEEYERRFRALSEDE